MKLWIIIYVAGQIGGSVGPVPYDVAECNSRAASYKQQIDKAIAEGKTPDGKPIPADQMSKLRLIHIACEYRDERPALGEKPV